MLSAKKIPPGGGGKIEVKIKTDNISGFVEKRVYVTTNDTQNPEIELKVTAEIQPEIAVSEYGIFFGAVPSWLEARREVFITLPAGKPIRLLGAETSDSRVSVKLEPVAGNGGRKWRLIAVRKSGSRPGDHMGEIIVRTTSRLTPRIVIYERGTVTTGK